MKKGLIIGFDGASFGMIERFLKEKKLPFLSQIYKKGAFGILESILPPFTMIAWPCFYTGKNPAKIGYFLIKSKGFDPEAFSKSFFLNSADIKAWTIWEYLSHLGYRVGVMNVPVTYPPVEVNGFLITDFMTPKDAEDFTYPPELKQKLKGYRISIDLDSARYGHKGDRKVNYQEIKKSSMEILREHGEWALKLIKDFSPDFFIINFKELDDFMHFFYGSEEDILDLYLLADSYTQKIYKTFKPDVFVIMSDHGFHKSPKTYFYINAFLEKRGYLKRAKSLRGRLSVFTYKMGENILRIMPFLQGFIPKRLKFKIAREDILHQVDWENSKCFANWYAGVYLNEKFFKDEKERKRFAEEIKKEFLSLRDDKGRKVFKFVYTKYEIFKGPYLDLMPEVVYTTDEDFRINPNLADKLFDTRVDRPYIKGYHHADLDGIFFIKADKIKEGSYGKRIKIYDIFPTFLYILGEKIPDDVDGRIPEDLFKEKVTPEFVKLPPKAPEEYEMEEEEAESVKKHLKGLGYI